MPKLDDIKKMVVAGKLSEAAFELNKMLDKDKSNDQIWYLRGVVSLKLKSYNYAYECLENALSIRKTAEYYKMYGIAHLEVLEIEEAQWLFEKAIALNNKDSENYFFLGLCHMLTDNPMAKENMQKAYLKDPVKTKNLLVEFYNKFIALDNTVPDSLKNQIKNKIESVSPKPS